MIPLVDKIIIKLKSEKVKKIFDKWELNFIYLYGSTARNQINWWSDLDLAISSSKLLKLSVNQQIDFLGESIDTLEQLLNIKNRPFDIRFIEHLNISLQFRIIKEGVLIYNRSPIKHRQFLEKTIRDHHDFAIWIDNLIKLTLKV
ncbi:MAG: nucleotidyltransferase domain-containing protein [Candidatus Ranarchaeia archaeon]